MLAIIKELEECALVLGCSLQDWNHYIETRASEQALYALERNIQFELKHIYNVLERIQLTVDQRGAFAQEVEDVR